MLPKWQSHKVVEASKILGVVRDAERTVLKLLDGDDVTVSCTYCAKHQPQVGGYFVRYKDGYESWSPAESFEAGYKRVEE